VCVAWGSTGEQGEKGEEGGESTYKHTCKHTHTQRHTHTYTRPLTPWLTHRDHHDHGVRLACV
jgi:hypothetical protein